MNKERLVNIIVKPWMTEKSSRLEAHGCHVFIVLSDASKIEIAQACKLLFNVDVQRVCTMNMKGKTKRHGHSLGTRKSFKKAMVTLQSGQTIQLAKLSKKAK